MGCRRGRRKTTPARCGDGADALIQASCCYFFVGRGVSAQWLQGVGWEAACIPRQQALQLRPLKPWPWVGLAAGCDVLVACDVGNGIALCQVGTQPCQGVVLGRFERCTLQPFELDADRIVVALAASAVVGCPCMPGALVAIDKLPERAIALDKEMG